MSVVTTRLLSEFDTLPADEKQAFMREALSRMPRWDSGPLDDATTAVAGDELAALLEQEEKSGDTSAR